MPLLTETVGGKRMVFCTLPEQEELSMDAREWDERALQGETDGFEVTLTRSGVFLHLQMVSDAIREIIKACKTHREVRVETLLGCNVKMTGMKSRIPQCTQAHTGKRANIELVRCGQIKGSVLTSIGLVKFKADTVIYNHPGKTAQSGFWEPQGITITCDLNGSSDEGLELSFVFDNSFVDGAYTSCIREEPVRH